MKKLFSTRTTDNAFSLGMLILRLGAGSLMMLGPGLNKLSKFAEYSQKFQGYFGMNATTSLALVVFAEFFCAAFIILGLFTRLAAIPLVIVMSVALFMAHKGQFFGEGSTAAIYLVCFLVLLICGAGKISLDRFISK